MNDILAHVIWKSFSFHLKKKKKLPTFPEFGLYSILFYSILFLYYILFYSILFYSILFILVCSIMNVVNILSSEVCGISIEAKFWDFPRVKVQTVPPQYSSLHV